MIFNYVGKAKYVHKYLQDQCNKQTLIAETLGIKAQDYGSVQGYKTTSNWSLKEFSDL